MDHPVRRSAANALRTDYLIQSGSDLVKLVIGTIRLMRPVRDYPKVSLPRHDRPGSTLSLGVVVSQMRVDAAEAFVPVPAPNQTDDRAKQNRDTANYRFSHILNNKNPAFAGLNNNNHFRSKSQGFCILPNLE